MTILSLRKVLDQRDSPKDQYAASVVVGPSLKVDVGQEEDRKEYSDDIPSWKDEPVYD
jgi:hypothetical protein